MRRICVVLIACIMVFGLSACGSNQSGTEVESKYTADTSFLDDVYIDDYMEEDREAIQSLCMGCGQDMAQVTSEQEYERVKHSFENRLAEYDSVQALAEYYESALHGYVDNFDDSVVKKSEIYSLYDDMKDDLYDAHTKADFYKACVDIDDEIEDKFGVSPRLMLITMVIPMLLVRKFKKPLILVRFQLIIIFILMVEWIALYQFQMKFWTNIKKNIGKGGEVYE